MQDMADVSVSAAFLSQQHIDKSLGHSHFIIFSNYVGNKLGFLVTVTKLKSVQALQWKKNSNEMWTKGDV